MLEFSSSPFGSCHLQRICQNCWSTCRLVGSISSPHSSQETHDHLFAHSSAESTKVSHYLISIVLAFNFAELSTPCNIKELKEWQEIKHWLPMSQEIYCWKEFCYFFCYSRSEDMRGSTLCVHKVDAKLSPDLFPAVLSSYASRQAPSLIDRKVRCDNWDPQARLSGYEKMHRQRMPLGHYTRHATENCCGCSTQNKATAYSCSKIVSGHLSYCP